ncbi:alpha/beta fold hydrolase [Aeromicrobium sp.]|uniref:alpha/beta hydrolase n=1 Tax=Aeromicrobium sp. TaxID=1871063 RepID=UPI0019916B52|nr:alpha/beta fold hydrolase [Aeromicrobium sp.]MBC7630615.1 alpha/beta fold hydrolase [Aeromicrobium sp.]
MRSDVDLTSHGTRLSAWHYTATDDALSADTGRPCVVMAHGFGATKDAGLEPYAERFQAAGADVLVFDYRGFGTSDGDLRQNVDHRRHREDYVAAIAHARTLDGVDPDRIVLWGSSYSGGHVVAVAAGDPRIAGVISQGAAMDGLAAVMLIWSYAGPVQLLKLTGHALRDVIGSALLGRPPHMIPIVGPPKSLAAISSHDGESGYQKIMGPTFRNEMCARGILPILINRPVSSAGRLHMPVFLVVAAKDTIAPVGAVERVGRKVAGSVQIERFDVGHFDIYDGEPFDTSVAAQVEFIRSLSISRR